jgi:ribosomal protein L11 methyltransferase
MRSPSYPSHDLAIAAFEAPGGRWDITMHFGEPPDEDFIRSLVTDAAGAAAAGSIVFGAVETKDWVKASLADLVPVSAGRFIVHGSHDRDRVPTNSGSRSRPHSPSALATTAPPVAACCCSIRC